MKLIDEEGPASVNVANAPKTVPTIGYSLEEFAIKNVNLRVWDLSGQLKMRDTWKFYYEHVNGIIFVLDASNTDQLSDVKETLHKVMVETSGQEFKEIPILVFANKQDKPNAARKEKLEAELQTVVENSKVPGAKSTRAIKIQECIGLTGVGLEEGF